MPPDAKALVSRDGLDDHGADDPVDREHGERGHGQVPGGEEQEPPARACHREEQDACGDAGQHGGEGPARLRRPPDPLDHVLDQESGSRDRRHGLKRGPERDGPAVVRVGHGRTSLPIGQ